MVKLFKFFSILCFSVLLTMAASADEHGHLFDFNKILQTLNTMENNLKSGNYTIQSVDENTNYLYQISNEIDEIKRGNEREARIVQKQLDALGDEPQDGIKELDVIAKKRTEFKNELAILKSHIAESDILQVKIDELNLLMLNSRNQKLLGDLVDKKAVLIKPENFISGLTALMGFLWDIAASPVRWYRGLDTSARSYVLTYLIPAFFILVTAFWIGLILRRFIMRNWGYRSDIDNPRYGQKISAAIAVAVAYGVIPSLIIGGFLLWMIGTQIFTIGFFGLIINSVLFY